MLQWGINTKLQLNHTKTKYLWFNQARAHVRPDFSDTDLGVTWSDSVKYLDIVFNPKLNWLLIWNM